MVCEYQVGGLIILHRNRFLIFGQGRYRGPYRGFERVFGRTWAHMHERFSGRRAYVCACPLNKHALVHVWGNLRYTCEVDRRALVRACGVNRRALERACEFERRTLARACMVNRRSLKRACEKNRRAYMRACIVNRCACVRACGW
jgi:hypothetical protein